MSSTQWLLASILLGSLLTQAIAPNMRVLVVTSGAAIACLASTLLGVATTGELLASVPWDVLVILVTLGMISHLFAESRAFDRLAVVATRMSQGDPRKISVVFAVAMYFVSGLVNNLTALVLVLPVLHVLLKLTGAGQRYVSWTLGVLLIACNLGGAATPIGDFPAILLLGRGSMTFSSYLVRAAPVTLVALLILLLVVRFGIRPSAEMPRDAVSTRLTCAAVDALHRRIVTDMRIFVPAAVALGSMILAWMALPARWRIGPELVCWLGVGGALVASRSRGERIARNGLDAEAVLFLLSLFVMVGAVSRTGIFDEIARGIAELPLPPAGQLVVFLLLAGVLTGLFSAGPAMAALLEVAASLAEKLPGPSVYVGLALSVCAGSSLFLTAATSGPLAQALTERANLRDPRGGAIRFGFVDFLPAGVVGFVIIESVALLYATLSLRFES